MDVLLNKAHHMFPEGLGKARAFRGGGPTVEKTNELLENATIAISKLFEQRGYDSCRFPHLEGPISGFRQAPPQAPAQDGAICTQLGTAPFQFGSSCSAQRHSSLEAPARHSALLFWKPLLKTAPF